MKEVVARLHHKDRQVSLESKPVYYTQLSEQRRCPLYKVDPASQVAKIKSYLQFMESFIEQQVKRVNTGQLGSGDHKDSNSRLSEVRESSERFSNRAASTVQTLKERPDDGAPAGSST